MAKSPRMTASTLNVLAVFLSRPAERLYGLEIAKATGLLTGSVHPILAKLEAAGWLKSDWEDIDQRVEGRRRRRYYEFTAQGRPQARQAVEVAQSRLKIMGTSWRPALAGPAHLPGAGAPRR